MTIPRPFYPQSYLCWADPKTGIVPNSVGGVGNEMRLNDNEIKILLKEIEEMLLTKNKAYVDNAGEDVELVLIRYLILLRIARKN